MPRTSARLAWPAAFALFGGALCFVPLFDVLGYEWCVAMGLTAAVGGAQIGAGCTTAARRRGTSAGTTPLETVVRLVGRALGRLGLALLLPLGLILANAARVRNCDVLGGLAWFGCLTLAAGAMGVALGVAVGLVRPWRSSWAPTALAFGGILLSIGAGVVRYIRTPPVFGYDPFVGYFPGSLYDEDVAIGPALLWARGYQATLGATALLACATLLDLRTLSLSLRAAQGRARLLGATTAGILLALGLYANRARLGSDIDAQALGRALGAEKRTDHFVLHYSPEGPYAGSIDLFALDFEFRWAEHTRLFPHAPARVLHAYLFDSAEQGRALVGASGTASGR